MAGGKRVVSKHLSGKILAEAAMEQGYEVGWVPSYGPEMRGGTANCIVIVADNRISSPIISKFDSAIVLNQPSLDKFESAVKPGGLLMYEKSTIINPPTRKDIDIVCIPAIEEADKLKAKQVANMVMVGAFLEKQPLVKIETIVNTLKKVLPEHRHKLIPVNEQALKRGRELVKETAQVSV